MVDIAGQGAIILNGPWGTEYTGGANVGDISHNLNFYIQRLWRNSTRSKYITAHIAFQMILKYMLCSNYMAEKFRCFGQSLVDPSGRGPCSITNGRCSYWVCWFMEGCRIYKCCR